jgi:toxin CptA
LFGVGALVNGACTFGSAARLGRGEIAFAAMPAGFVIGVMIAAKLVDAPAARALAGDPASTDIAITGLVFYVGYQLFRLSDAAGDPRAALARLAAPIWPPSLAMGVIGLSSALLMIFFAPWPYSNLLTDLGASAPSAQTPLKIALALAFVGGAAIGAYTRGALKFVKPSPRDIVEKTAAGVLMGAGSFVIPGGNDSIVLVGLPHLFAYAVVAYLSMTAAISAILLVGAKSR